MTALEVLAQAVLDGRVSVEVNRDNYGEMIWSYRIVVEPSTEEASR